MPKEDRIVTDSRELMFHAVAQEMRRAALEMNV